MAQTFDERTEKNLATLLLPAAEIARRFLRAVQASGALPAGYQVKVISGLRSYAEQDALYQQGRTRPGDIVTNARGGQSNHNFGSAFDIGVFDKDGRYLTGKTAVESAIYERLGPIGEAVGLEWGGRWRFDDDPHYQLRLGLTVAEMDRRHRAGVSVLAGTAYESGVPASVRPTNAAARPPVTLVVAGSPAPPYEVSADATDEIRFVVEAMGGSVGWDPATRRITAVPPAGKGL